jgi:PAS domain S-box-containing protein
MIQESPAIPSNFFAPDSDIKNFFQLFSKAPVGIAVFMGPSFVVGLVNENTLEIWGKRRDDVLGKPLFEIFPDFHHTELSGIMNKVYAQGERFQTKEYEVKFLKNKKTVTRYFDFTFEPVLNSGGTIMGIVGIASEITQEVINRKKLKESEERFNSIANDAPQIIWFTDDNLQTTYINKTALNYFGLDESIDLTLFSWKKFIHPDDIDRVLAIMLDAAKKNLPYTLEMRLKNGVTGNYRWFLDEGIPRYDGNKFIGFIGTSLDIQDRKETEAILENKVKERTKELDHQNKLLKKQNELVKKIIDSTLDLIAVYDTETRIITINQAALDLFGYSEEDVIGKKLTDVFPQFANAEGIDDLHRALNGETIHNDIYQSSATGKYYENFLIPLPAEDNRIYAALAIAHDNTNLIYKNKELNEVQQIALLGNWDWKPEKNEIHWSEQMYRIYGYEQKESPIGLEKAVERMLPQDAKKITYDMSEYVAEAKRLWIENGQTVFTTPPFEYPIVLPDGSKKILRGGGKIILTPDGEILKIMGTVLDITEQKKREQQIIDANEKLEERNQFVEKLINSSLDAIIVVDKELRFITINKKAESVLRSHYPGDLIGMKMTEIAPSLNDSETHKDLLKAFEGKIIIRDKVKSVFSENYFEHNYIPLQNASGKVYAVMIISHDITENMRQLEELKKLNESDKLKSDFIKMASHELKTPITSIKGYVQLLLTALKNEEPKTLSPLLIRSSLISIDKQTTRLTRLMSELLDLTKIETGRLELNKELFSLNELVIETVQDILYTNSKHSINIFHDFGCTVYGDKDRIGQALINLLTNAVKYSPDSDKIEVWVHQPAKNFVSVSVKDYGIGIDKRYQRKIFERFYRVEGKEEQTFPGFGIGLFIAKEIIHRHDGTIEFTSKKGKGSVFTFTLPVVPVQKNQK